jgi:hypothetical protein
MSEKNYIRSKYDKIPTYHEAATGMMKATDPFSGKYSKNIWIVLSTKTPEFKQLLRSR